MEVESSRQDAVGMDAIRKSSFTQTQVCQGQGSSFKACQGNYTFAARMLLVQLQVRIAWLYLLFIAGSQIFVITAITAALQHVPAEANTKKKLATPSA